MRFIKLSKYRDLRVNIDKIIYYGELSWTNTEEPEIYVEERDGCEYYSITPFELTLLDREFELKGEYE